MLDYGHDVEPRGAPIHQEPSVHPCVRASGRSVPSDSELRELLERHQGNVAAVGRELGKARMQIHRWMQRYGIEIDEFRSQ
jgi:transcriptional regulator with GAF, ATPase, and Fis domain